MVVARLAKRIKPKLLHRLSACMRFRADHPGRVLARGNQRQDRKDLSELSKRMRMFE
jgi:hypothetical protein